MSIIQHKYIGFKAIKITMLNLCDCCILSARNYSDYTTTPIYILNYPI